MSRRTGPSGLYRTKWIPLRSLRRRWNASRNYNMTICAKSWAEVIEQCSARRRFFRERLNYNASQSSGKRFLIDTYPKFIPKFEKGETDSAASEVNTEVPAPTPPTASPIPADTAPPPPDRRSE